MNPKVRAIVEAVEPGRTINQGANRSGRTLDNR
jgi:hypothetical protein